MGELIRIGGILLDFLQDGAGTSGGLDLFRMTVAPDAKVPAPHYHESWDETVYGLSGALTFRIDGAEVLIEEGASAFIPRGAVHDFRNLSAAPAACLCVLTPGVLGPQYFRDLAALVAAGPPDPAEVAAIMRRYGLVPVPG